MKLAKKPWPVLLLAALLLSLVPAGALAADDTAVAPAVVLTFSDFQASGGSSPDERRANSRKNVEELLAAVKKDYPTADGLIFCGDQVEIRRYDKNGPHDVKSEGFVTKITGGVVDWADKNVYASPVVCEAPAAFPVVWVCVGAAVLAAAAAVLIVRASRRKKTAAQ